jgi:hypothetical protein
VSDPTEHGKEQFVLFHSLVQTYPWIDCIYKDESGAVTAIQITTGNTHNINDTVIQRLHEDVGTVN